MKDFVFLNNNQPEHNSMMEMIMVGTYGKKCSNILVNVGAEVNLPEHIGYVTSHINFMNNRVPPYELNSS